MNCDERQLAISMMIDNECAEEELQGLFAHLGACPSCRQFYRESMNLRTRLHRQCVPSVPASVDAHVLSHIRDRKILRMPSWLTSRILIPAPLAAAALILIILGTFAFLKQRATHPSSFAEHEIVYVTTLPVVEVEGIMPNSSLHIQ
jgi:predicted anti-sigma-YlaC factor YlaD